MEGYKSSPHLTPYWVGDGIMEQIAERAGSSVIFTTVAAWIASEHRFRETPLDIVLLDDIDASNPDGILDLFPDSENVIAIGGKKVMQLAAHISALKANKFFALPSQFCSELFLPSVADIRKTQQNEQIVSRYPDILGVDFEFMKVVSGEALLEDVGSLMAMHTACFDWQYAESKGKSNVPFSSPEIEAAGKVLDNLYTYSAAIRNLTTKGMQTLWDSFHAIEQLCQQLKHGRLLIGSEHYLLYILEKGIGYKLPYGKTLGLCVYLMSQLQGNHPGVITQIMEELGLDFRPGPLNICTHGLTTSLLNLRSFVEENPKLSFSCIHDSDISPDWIQGAIQDLEF